ncbi:MAG: OsmC family protein [Candidatus Bathyarchaeia archaeon]
MTAKLHASAELLQGVQIALENGRSHRVIVDQPAGTGTDAGATPLELCVMSHAGCYATVMALAAKRMRITLHGLTVKVTAIKSEEAGTITEETFDITVKTDAPQDRVQRLHEVTLKNCPVGILFEKANVKTAYNLTVIKG